MILLDTCAILHKALSPEKLGKQAAECISAGIYANSLACCDISLWEIALLIRRQRVKPDAETSMFIERTLLALQVTVLPITAEIAVTATDNSLFVHKDPTDRIIVATALHHSIPLVTCDSNLSGIAGLITIW